MLSVLHSFYWYLITLSLGMARGRGGCSLVSSHRDAVGKWAWYSEGGCGVYKAGVIATSDFRACFIVLGGCSAKSCLLLLSPVVVIMCAPLNTEQNKYVYRFIYKLHYKLHYAINRCLKNVSLISFPTCEWMVSCNFKCNFLAVQSRLDFWRVGTECVPCLVQFSNQFCLLFMQRTPKRQTRTATFHFPSPLDIFPPIRR